MREREREARTISSILEYARFASGRGTAASRSKQRNEIKAP